jgi:hypothetical protein
MSDTPSYPVRLARRRIFQVLAAVGTAALLPRSASGFGADDVLTLGVIRHAGTTWNPRPTALRRLMMEVEMTTSILVAPEAVEVDPTTADLFAYPLLVLAGDRGFDAFTEEARAAIRSWLSAGGTLFIDSSEGRTDGEFDASVRREVVEFAPGGELLEVPVDHVLFKSFYLVPPSSGRNLVSEQVFGVTLDERLAIVYSHNDHMGAWARDNFGSWEYPVHPGGDEQRDMAMRFGVNLVMYAMCLDYKADQVHVPFILQRRRWQVGP